MFIVKKFLKLQNILLKTKEIEFLLFFTAFQYLANHQNTWYKKIYW